MSHTLWSGLFVWLSNLLVALLFYGRTQLDWGVEPQAAVTAKQSGATRVGLSTV